MSDADDSLLDDASWGRGGKDEKGRSVNVSFDFMICVQATGGCTSLEMGDGQEGGNAVR